MVLAKCVNLHQQNVCQQAASLTFTEIWWTLNNICMNLPIEANLSHVKWLAEKNIGGEILSHSLKWRSTEKHRTYQELRKETTMDGNVEVNWKDLVETRSR